MKKSALILTLLVALTSCKRNYTCDCTDNTTQTLTTYNYIASNKGSASSNCIMDHGTNGATCAIK